MGVFQLMLWVAGIGLFAYALIRFVPMSEGMPKVISIIAIVVAVWVVLSAFGLIPHDIAVPRFEVTK